MKNQKGFSAVIVLLSLLLLVAVGFTGYFVWNTQNSKKDTTAEVAPATATKQETKVETPAPAKEEQKYLVIKEWGVKIPLDNKIQDAKYTKGSNDIILLSKTTYSDEWSSCNGAGGAIMRFMNASDDIFAENTMYYNQFDLLAEQSIKIDGYYYYYQSPMSMCGDPNNQEIWAQKSGEMVTGFSTAAKKIQKN